MNIRDVIYLVNNGAVSIFGGVLSAAFCGALDSRKNRLIFTGSIAVMLLPQVLIYLSRDAGFMMRIYPLVVHLPLWGVLWLLTGRLLWPAISILSAYLFCQLRRWLALLTVVIFSGGESMRELAELIFTVPLLLLLVRFAVPPVRRLGDYPTKTQCQFGLIPALYYGFDYLTRVYTDLIFTGEPVVAEFMPTVCCGAYLVFLLYNSAEERQRAHLRQVQDNLRLQLTQAIREIGALRESQDMAARYRHDLRHHLQYLSSCIENRKLDRAQDYISSIYQQIEAQQIQRYCENEAANLILTSFAARAEKMGVTLRIQGNLPAFHMLSDSDLCVLLSNSLENALFACQALPGEEERTVSVQFYEKMGKFFLQITNPCGPEVRFENGVPVSDRPGHGIGVQSICAIVDRCGGLCSFSAENGEFVFRLSL